MQQFDAIANAFFTPEGTSPLVDVFLWITRGGASSALTPLLVVVSGLIWVRGRWRLIGGLWTYYMGTELTVWAVKHLVDRHRPSFIVGVTASSPSFPSAHAAGAAAAYGFIGLLFVWQFPRHNRVRVSVATVTAACVLLVGFSRIFLSVRYVTDVLAGYVLAVVWAGVGVLVVATLNGAHRNFADSDESLGEIEPSGWRSR